MEVIKNNEENRESSSLVTHNEFTPTIPLKTKKIKNNVVLLAEKPASYEDVLEFVKTHSPLGIRKGKKLISPFINEDVANSYRRYMALSIMKLYGGQ